MNGLHSDNEGKRRILEPGTTTFREVAQAYDRVHEMYSGLPSVPHPKSIAAQLDKELNSLFSRLGCNIEYSLTESLVNCVVQSVLVSRDCLLFLKRGEYSNHVSVQVLLRSLMLGAAKPVYILNAGSSEQRARRTFEYVLSDLSYALNAAESFNENQHFIHLQREDLISSIAVFRDWAKKHRIRKLVETRVLKDASESIQNEMSKCVEDFELIDRVFEEQLDYTWRFSSAYSHGLGWLQFFNGSPDFSPGSPFDEYISANMLLEYSLYILKNLMSEEVIR